MKTQINELRSGVKNQILNDEIDYSKIPKDTQHFGHSGSNYAEVEAVWEKVIAENPESMKVVVKGIEVDLTANWSMSRKSVSYKGVLLKETLTELFFLNPTEDEAPCLYILNGNLVKVANGNNDFHYLCPSLIEII